MGGPRPSRSALTAADPCEQLWRLTAAARWAAAGSARGQLAIGGPLVVLRALRTLGPAGGRISHPARPDGLAAALASGTAASDRGGVALQVLRLALRLALRLRAAEAKRAPWTT